MRMRADDGGHPAVEIPAHRFLLGGRLGVQIDKRRIVFPAPTGENTIRHLKGISCMLQIHHTRQVQHQHARRAAVKHGIAAARRGGGQIGGTQDIRAVVQHGVNRPVVQRMVAAGEHIDARVEQTPRILGRDTHDAGGVLAVGDHHVAPKLPPQPPQSAAQRVRRRAADNIAEH